MTGEKLKGKATPKGTEDYFKSLSEEVFNDQSRIFGATGWRVSPFGFGGYRVTQDQESQRRALSLALSQGCNLIDTSTNYSNGDSERLVGEVLKQHIAEGSLSRDQVVVVSKIGYIQGDNIDVATQRQKQGKAFSETVKVQDDCWHCISPDFIEDQLTRSLERLGLETLDVLLLHNPEYFMKAIKDSKKYYEKIQEAFEYLEKEVTRGRIQSYGISSNTLGELSSDEAFTSLEDVAEAAQQVSKDHHFQVIQFPLNLFEAGGAFVPSNSGRTVLEVAEEFDLGVMFNRPLNSFDGKRMLRLSDFPDHGEGDHQEALLGAFSFAKGVEEKVPSPKIPMDQMGWASLLEESFDQMSEISTWREVSQNSMVPALESYGEIFKSDPDPEIKKWFLEYEESLLKLMRAITVYLESVANKQSSRIKEKIDSIFPELHSSQTLSQKLVRLYASLSESGVVLVGMRKPEYVQDVLKAGALMSTDRARSGLQDILS
jgi:uncharacterized protein